MRDREVCEAWRALEQGVDMEALRLLARLGKLGERPFTCWGPYTKLYSIKTDHIPLSQQLSGLHPRTKRTRNYRYTCEITPELDVIVETWDGGLVPVRLVKNPKKGHHREPLRGRGRRAVGILRPWRSGAWIRHHKGKSRLLMDLIDSKSWQKPRRWHPRDLPHEGMVVGVTKEMNEWILSVAVREFLGLTVEHPLLRPGAVLVP